MIPWDGKFESFDKIVKLEIIGYEEPNNGRDLLIPKITKNGVEITQEICDKARVWNRFPMFINCEFFHPNLPFVFLPFEREYILYNYIENQISIVRFDVKYPESRFITNTFIGNYCIVLSQKTLIIKNLVTKKFNKVKLEKDELFEEIISWDEKQITIKKAHGQENFLIISLT